MLVDFEAQIAGYISHMSKSRSLSCQTLMAGVPHLATNSRGPRTESMDLDAMIAASR